MYIYRWGGTGSCHMSGFGHSMAGENVGHDRVEIFVQQRASRGEIPLGPIPLQPGWQTDHRQLVASYIAILAEQQAPLTLTGAPPGPRLRRELIRGQGRDSFPRLGEVRRGRVVQARKEVSLATE